jgi:hypothetical protein
MKIYIKTAADTQAYLPVVVKALQSAGHEVRYKALVRNDSAGKEGCDLCLELTAGGLQKLVDKPAPAVAVVQPREDVRIEKLILVIGESVLPRRAIVDGLQLKQKSRAIFINNYLKPAVSKGYITMTQPAHPNLPAQAYRLTPKGLDLFRSLKITQG